MSLANLGRVLIAMAGYAKNRIEQRREYLGKENIELLYAISYMFQIGAEKCLEIEKEEKE